MVSITDKVFKMEENFSIDDYFNGCCGIILNTDIPMEHVVVRAYDKAPDYLRTLPWHPSQKEISKDEESAIFSFEVRPTYDFIQLVMQQGDQVEILEPASLRNHMKNLANTLTSYYKI